MQQQLDRVARATVPVEPQIELITRSRTYTVAKRTFDILFALTVLVMSAPLWLLAALLVRLTSPGPVIYRQDRAGLNGRAFTCYKFRTMVNDADQRKGDLQHLNEMSGPVFKIRADPRVTPVGRWLRKTSIDEFPQLLNVLKGDMSVVGPRPLPVAESDQLTAHQRQRLLVKPGLTCIWQVSGRSEVDFAQWIAMDLEYIKRRSFWYDILLVVWTVPAVIATKGAR